MAKDSKTFNLGRRASNGRFVPVEVARKDRDHCVVERVPKAGNGDTKDK